MKETLAMKLVRKLDERNYKNSAMTLGYLDAIDDLNPLEDSRNYPKLNENQKLLLEDLNDIREYHSEKNVLGLTWVLGQRLENKSDIKDFTNQEILEVLTVFQKDLEMFG